MLDTYTRMLAKHRRIKASRDRGFHRENYLLSLEELKQIAAARVTRHAADSSAATRMGAMTDDAADSTRDGPTADLGVVADAMANADEASLESWRAETDLWDELAIADADYAAGNTISGEELRRRYGLS